MDPEKKNRTKEILSGVLVAFGIWVAGILLTGKIMFIDEIEFHLHGRLVALFPWIFGAVCVAVAAVSAKKDLPCFFRTALTAMFLPAAALLIYLALDGILEATGLGATPVDAVRILFALPAIPAASVFGEYDSVADGIIAYSVFLLPMAAGLIAALAVYRRYRRKNSAAE
ncbi:MAG: hypothetical protein IK118_01075 [Clostridia bacterium]|nr:hypothetical protein [Clostridia bacterium]